MCTCLKVSLGSDAFCDSFPLGLERRTERVTQRLKEDEQKKNPTNYVSEEQRVPECAHAAYNHDSTDDADTFVLWHSAGELFADHNVHVILGEHREERGPNVLENNCGGGRGLISDTEFS